MARKTSKGGGILGAIALAALGAAAASRSENKNTSKVRDSKRSRTKQTMEKIDDLTVLMNHMNKLLMEGTLKSNYYMQIGQQACKEYKSLGGILHLENGVEFYVKNKLEFIQGVEQLQNKLKRTE